VSRIQNPEVEKKTEVRPAPSFSIVNSGFWIQDSAV
jgi:hypothetical protein